MSPTQDGPRLTAAQTVEAIVRERRLQPLPHEGGWFRRIAPLQQETPDGGRASEAVIEALFTPDQFSALHRLDVEEQWTFLAGSPLDLWQFSPQGGAIVTRLGAAEPGASSGAVVVAPGVWQGAQVAPGGGWSLVRCVTRPEFRWTGFELARRDELVVTHPRWTEMIEALTRPVGP